MLNERISARPPIVDGGWMRPAHEFEEAMRWIEMGMTKRQVAELMDIPKPTIDSWRRYGRGSLKRGPNHSFQTYKEAMHYIVQGMNDCEVSRVLKLPRGTIRDWRHAGRFPNGIRTERDCPTCTGAEIDASEYGYLLGLYLGDGCIATLPRGVFKLRIALDKKYPGIIEECEAAMLAMRPLGSMRVGRVNCEGCFEVTAHWKHWPCLFPQHGPGRKHEREIRLEDWQEDIMRSHSYRVLRGLIHSDGCRFQNPVTVRGRRYVYPRYQFTNHSGDIRDIFCRACDYFGVEWKQATWRTIAVSRAASVARLDRVVGPKE